MIKTSKDGNVIFIDSDHSYYLGKKKLQSVTNYVSQYKNKFDTEFMASRYAIKHSLNKEDVIKTWCDKGQRAIKQGVEVHTYFEDYINKGIIKKTKGKEDIAKKFINEIFKTERLTPIETEMIVYNDSLAGQIDCIAKDQKGNFYILDWKTNNKIDTYSYKKKMITPYDNFNDASFYHYSLQLTLYKNLCTEYDIKDSFIVHIDTNNYKIIKICEMPIL